MNIIILAATPKEIPGELTEICGCPIEYTGVGKINAAMRTTEIINDEAPDWIINIGSCGAIDDIEIGRLLCVGTVCNDIETHPFAPYGVTPFTNGGNISLDKTDIQCVTADRFYDKYRTDYSKAYLKRVNESQIVDMELYAIAQVCHEYSTKCLSYKWVSDTGTPNDWDNNKQIGFDKFVETLKKLITNNR